LIGQFFPGYLPKFGQLSKEIEASLRLMGDRLYLTRSGAVS
jgi:hypothetical protein